MGGGIDGWIPPPHQVLLVLDAASSSGNSGRPAVDGLLPVGSCWFLGWFSGLPARSLPGRSAEILLSMETSFQLQLSDATCTLFLVFQPATLYTLPVR
jgi:hypothetical protein